MNIEIANRLVQLRKDKGLSQEELAARLGISRQAVSKWERAESSPDTDNLILLARLYGVSLDNLLQTDGPVGVAEGGAPQPPAEQQAQAGPAFAGEMDSLAKDRAVQELLAREKANGGFHDRCAQAAQKEDEAQRMYAQAVRDQVGHEAYDENARACAQNRAVKEAWQQSHPVRHALDAVYPLLMTILFFLFGFLCNGWWWAWLLFMTIPLYYAGLSAAYAVYVTVLFLLLGLTAGVWHPAWLLFLTIPVFYVIREKAGSTARFDRVANRVLALVGFAAVAAGACVQLT